MECDKAMNEAWAALKKGADVNQDQEVTMDEWHQYWAQFVAKSKGAAGGWPQDMPWIKDYMDFWFDLLDTSGSIITMLRIIIITITHWAVTALLSGDALIDINEFTQVCTNFGVPEADAKACFHKFGTKPVSPPSLPTPPPPPPSKAPPSFQVDRTYFSALWLQYMTSNSPNDPGNFVFGKLN